MNRENTHTSRSLIKTLGIVIYTLFISCLIILLFAERWLFSTWAELSADEILYHMKSSVDGTNPAMIKEALIKYGFPAAVLIAVIIALLFFLRRNKRVFRIYFVFTLIIALSTIAFLKHDLDKRINFTTYLMRTISGSESDFIEDNYTDPKNLTLSFPERKRNLVYIYLESLEMTYADKDNGGAFDVNVIPELTKIAEENDDFSGDSDSLNGGISLPGTNWTMGAMFGMSTGLPLKIDLGGNGMQDQDSFFPDIDAVGDILDQQGYKQELLIGSKAKFGGRDVFYEAHGNYQINDYNYAKKNGRIPEDYKVFWGYEDQKLFEFAKEDLTELSKGSQPFNLTMLTVDTHFEDGYKCELCKDDLEKEFGEQYADVMACSSRQVSEFIQWIQEQSFYENTTIIVCGDHPTMDKTFCKNIPDSYQRKTYVAVINADAELKKPEKRREYSTLDLFPTTLAALGVSIPGDRLGLGVNLYSDENTLIEKYGIEECESELEFPSKFMERISGISITEETLASIPEKAVISIKKKKDDKVKLSIKGVHYVINRNIIEKMELELTDKESGQTETYTAEAVFTKRDPNKYTHEVTIDLKGKDLEDYEGVFYLYVDGIDHYKIADFEHNMEE